MNYRILSPIVHNNVSYTAALYRSPLALLYSKFMPELGEKNFEVIVLDLRNNFAAKHGEMECRCKFTSSPPQICARVRRGRGGKSVNAKVWRLGKDHFSVKNLIYLNACWQ
jgi:hypothetical protein